MAPIRIAVLGAAGHMGREILAVVAASEASELSAALVRAGDSRVGEDAGTLFGQVSTGMRITDDLDAAIEGSDAFIDFTTPELTAQAAPLLAAKGRIHVIGTTGFDEAQEATVAEAARAGARIVKSGNMSLGVNLLAGLIEQAARALGPEDFDIEVLEMHHRRKVDAPSGTAFIFGEAAAKGRGIDLAENSVRVRDGRTGPRETGTIGFATLRGGSVVGEHTVYLAGEGERIALSHQAGDRAIFARGAVKAALWAAERPAGLYSMRHVLGLEAAEG